eukprot:m.22917 g.22917  ORF g.22917 m.22917 type:complete len:407 (-) comp3822_c0_seq1:109-1329(-)
MASAAKPSKAALLTPEELAAMDDDEFFHAYAEGRVARRADAWTEDNWEEKFETTPLFMTKAPTAEQVQASPELSALQEIVNEYTPEESAKYSKDHGNAAFLKGKAATAKKLRLAELRRSVLLYSEGLDAKCDNAELNSTLLSNRAAANLLLENFRQVIVDCTRAIALLPTNAKAYFRAGTAALRLDKFDEAMGWADKGLLAVPACEELVGLRAEIAEKRAAAEKLRRKLDRQARERENTRKTLATAIVDRGVRLVDNARKPISLLDDKFVHTELPGDAKVHLDANNELVWPAMIQYPEHQTVDIIAKFRETATFADELAAMLPDDGEAPEWDVEKKYKVSQLAVYFTSPVDSGKQKMFAVPMESTLGDALRHPRYVVSGGAPIFLVLVRGSPFEASLLKLYPLAKA